MGERAEKMRMELRRGILVLAVLATLREEHYGYSLRKRLAAAHMDIEEGTLYPLIRRLEGYGLLDSEWRETDGRRRRYYRTSDAGRELLATLSREWRVIGGSLGELLEGVE